jgi:hypothetical protein
MGMREFWLNVLKPWQERRRLNDTYTADAAVRQPIESRQPLKRLKR